MQNFFCAYKERVPVSKVYDYLMKNADLKPGQVDNFNELLCGNLGIDEDSYDEVTMEEFNDEFLDHFRHNKTALFVWNVVKNELTKNECELWV